MSSNVIEQDVYEQKPWYKQFWPWFLIALPATVVVACIYTVIIAFNHEDSLVRDNYYKDGLGINRELSAQQVANDLSIALDMHIDVVTGEVMLDYQSESGVLPLSIRVDFIHPTNADKDFSLELLPGLSQRYQAQLEQSVTGRWYLHFSSEQPQYWQLKTVAYISADEDAEIDMIVQSQVGQL